MKKTFEQKLMAIVTLMYSIVYDYYFTESESGDEIQEYIPVWVNGVFDPKLAYKIVCRCQGKIFSKMKKMGMPLYGWNQFDEFCRQYKRTSNLLGSYRSAQRCTKTYVWEYIGEEDGKSIFQVKE